LIQHFSEQLGTILRAIKFLIIEYLTRLDFIAKHKYLLTKLVWEDEDSYSGELVWAIRCPLNPGIPDLDGSLEAYINVDDNLASAVNKHNLLRLLAATIKAIFTVYDCPNIEVQQCPFSLEKWEELVVGLIQTVLGRTIDTNRLTVGITPEYLWQVTEL
jgi:hypothetical protein